MGSLLDGLPKDAHVEIITTLPNRYSSFSREAPELESHPGLTVRRVKLSEHHSGMLDQARAFAYFAYNVIRLTKKSEYQLVIGTSSRLMTAVLSAYVARRKKVPLYLDIRDIFVDTIGDILSKKLAVIFKPIFIFLERFAIKRAAKVNLVSFGFKEYFSTRYPDQQFSFFTNGVDEEFLDEKLKLTALPPREEQDKEVTVLYAGNIGEGQGLHAIIPELAKRLEGRVRFRLIGDGGRRCVLESKLKEMGCDNVELLPPVNRSVLIREYQNADVLFLHLNSYPAFEKVLPSKLFEYAAMGKPVWAGLSGYSANFVKEEIENAALFMPCDVGAAVASFEKLAIEEVDRAAFIRKFARKNIMRRMVKDILSLAS